MNNCTVYVSSHSDATTRYERVFFRLVLTVFKTQLRIKLIKKTEDVNNHMVVQDKLHQYLFPSSFVNFPLPKIDLLIAELYVSSNLAISPFLCFACVICFSTSWCYTRQQMTKSTMVELKYRHTQHDAVAGYGLTSFLLAWWMSMWVTVVVASTRWTGPKLHVKGLAVLSAFRRTLISPNCSTKQLVYWDILCRTTIWRNQ